MAARTHAARSRSSARRLRWTRGEYERGDELRVVAHLVDGGTVDGRDGRLDADLSGTIFRRDGAVASLRVDVWGR